MLNFSEKLDLQRFAEGDGDGEGSQGTGAENTNTNTQGDGQGTDNPNSQQTDPNAIVFKSQSDLDSWYDKKTAGTLEKAKAKWEKEAHEQKDYDKMTPAEQQAFDNDKRAKELDQKEQDMNIKLNRAGIVSRLSADGLPTSLADVFADASLNVKKVEDLDPLYQTLKTAYQGAVREGVDKKLVESANTPGAAGAAAGKKSAGETIADKRNDAQKPAGSNPWAIN
ncbi:MAG TPA: DUF4355 domain-containing protein [Candidatus Levilactobacillus faecigallinarum]|uniref:DUF4355 domain-containing protein n=1 Tax=Candidatus Levilactobacillus faecigallinarum TaxID=2838638 RepID=A0A9D1QSF1_9LACO|nr:DUF4355 domain-containing protein [Candidatus Levilactobacillus faecigallinarum]